MDGWTFAELRHPQFWGWGVRFKLDGGSSGDPGRALRLTPAAACPDQRGAAEEWITVAPDFGPDPAALRGLAGVAAALAA